MSSISWDMILGGLGDGSRAGDLQGVFYVLQIHVVAFLLPNRHFLGVGSAGTGS